MKTQLELKLNKLPETVQVNSEWYDLHMTRFTSGDELVWCIEYQDEVGNSIFSVQHKSIQACVDSALGEINKINYLSSPEGQFMSMVYNAHPNKFDINSLYT